MRSVSLILLLLVAASCTNIPELDGSETKSLRKAPYPELVPLSDVLGPPADPISEAEDVQEDLTARSEALAEKAQALQNAEIN